MHGSNSTGFGNGISPTPLCVRAANCTPVGNEDATGPVRVLAPRRSFPG